MPPTDLPEPTRAFRAWANQLGDFAAAQAATGIGERKLQRLYSGKDAPRPRLLRELAEGADQTGNTTIGRRLRNAADALEAGMESHHA